MRVYSHGLLSTSPTARAIFEWPSSPASGIPPTATPKSSSSIVP
jgi:hypothetical protein